MLFAVVNHDYDDVLLQNPIDCNLPSVRFRGAASVVRRERSQNGDVVQRLTIGDNVS